MLVLASASPRRQELLRRVGLEFEPRPVHVDETPPADVTPEAAVQELARRKADAAAAQRAGEDFVLAADTAVVLDGRWLGKPTDEADAKRILSELSGRTHRVLTGVVVKAPDGTSRGAVVETRVAFRNLSESEIRAYVATREPLDKAGAYGIQGLAVDFVADLEGDYTNVVGLPMRRTLELLVEAGYPLPSKLKPS